jgi:hypothetical protein
MEAMHLENPWHMNGHTEFSTSKCTMYHITMVFVIKQKIKKLWAGLNHKDPFDQF